MPAAPRPFTNINNIGSAAAGTAEVAIVVSSAKVKVLIHSLVSGRKTGVSATNFRPRLYNKAGEAAETMYQKYRAAATAPTVLVGVVDISMPCYTDTAGKLYFKADGDAADTFEYDMWLEVLS